MRLDFILLSPTVSRRASWITIRCDEIFNENCMKAGRDKGDHLCNRYTGVNSLAQPGVIQAGIEGREKPWFITSSQKQTGSIGLGLPPPEAASQARLNMLISRIFVTIFFVLTGAGSAIADCRSGEEVDIFRELKTDFLEGEYDRFFSKADPSGALPEKALQDTKVKLIQYIGVPVTCVDMVEKVYSNNYRTLLTAFLGKKGEMVFFFFSALRVDGRDKIIGVQLSTDYSEIYKYVR